MYEEPFVIPLFFLFSTEFFFHQFFFFFLTDKIAL